MPASKKTTKSKTATKKGAQKAAIPEATKILQEKFQDLFEIESELDVNTLVANAITTYGQLAHLSSQGLTFYVGKQGAGEVRPIHFPFEIADDIEGPSVKLKQKAAA